MSTQAELPALRSIEALSQLSGAITEWAKHMQEQGVDDLQIVSGLRYLFPALSSTSTAQTFADRDPHRPKWSKLGPTAPIIFGNSDTDYRSFILDPQCSYRVSGSIEDIGCSWIGFCLYGTGQGARDFQVDGDLALEDLKTDSDGRFEIILSQDRADDAQNWIQLREGSAMFMIRQYFLDADSDKSIELHPIEVLAGGKQAVPVPRKVHEIDQDVVNKVHGLAGHLRWIMRLHEFGDSLRETPNRFVAFGTKDEASGWIMPNPGTHYVVSAFKIQQDQALIIDGAVSGTPYWSLILHDRWFQVWTEWNTAINNSQASANSDGSFRIVIAHQNPGVDNWVDTGGQTEGYLMFRWLTVADASPPSTRLVALSEVLETGPLTVMSSEAALGRS